jgi:thiamine transporter ThiT
MHFLRGMGITYIAGFALGLVSLVIGECFA